MSYKKGIGLESLYPAVLAILIVGIALGVGIYTLDATGNAISTVEFSVANESLATVDERCEVITTADDCGFNSMTVVRITNTTQTIPATNYTVDTTTGTVCSTGSAPYNGTTWNITYSYYGPATGSQYCSSIATTSTGVGGLASWIGVIVVVIAAAIVLGIVINSFMGGKTGI